MHASVRAFLDHIIDYAGLFPPAKLPLDEAVRNYVDVGNQSSHRWMLRSFVCPTASLHDLAALGQRINVAALGQAVAQVDAFVPQLDADMTRIEEYRARTKAGVATYEAAIPAGLSPEQLAKLLERFVDTVKRHRLRGFLEIPLGPSWADDISNLCQASGACRARMNVDSWLGLKLRCGGMKPEAFPSNAEVAHFIERCQATNLRWKATAGLHHPRRYWDEQLQVWHHGFLNLFAAGVLARTQATVPNLIELLADRELAGLRFERDRMVWQSWTCDLTEIAEARAEFATSFGSCSFEEPTDDLSALGLLTSREKTKS